MKTLLLAFLCLALPLAARPPVRSLNAEAAEAQRQKGKAKPPSTVTAPKVVTSEEPPAALPESVPMARQRTVQEDAELRDWIVGIQTTAQDAVKRADAAKAEAKTSWEQSAVATFQSKQASKQLLAVDAKFARQEKELADDKVKLARFGKLVTLLALVAALAAALYTFEMLKPAGLLGKLLSITGPGVQYGAPLVVFIFVFGAVEVYLRYVF